MQGKGESRLGEEWKSPHVLIKRVEGVTFLEYCSSCRVALLQV